ncbi:MAG: c-type cytochrome [Janthinobacterium lividum]
MNNCNACHRSSGAGANGVSPLAGRQQRGRREGPDLADPHRARRFGHAGLRPAPGAWCLTDADVAELLSFVRGSWGNGVEAVTAAQVATVRKGPPGRCGYGLRRAATGRGQVETRASEWQ